MSVNYIICAAGEGRRTKAIHPTRCKPLLRLNGKTLLEWSLSCLPIQESDKVFIIHQAKDPLGQESLPTKAAIHFLALSEVTSGQLETAMLAVKRAAIQGKVAIFNVDTYFECAELVTAMNDQQWDGLIPCSQEPGDSWSFCLTKEQSRQIVKVTEKERISPWCSAGFYYFKEAQIFLEYAEKEIQSVHGRHEAYVAPLYNRYIQEQRKIGLLPIQKFKAMGSLEQFQFYWGKDLKDLQKENT